MVNHLKKGEELTSVVKNGFYLVDFYADWCGPCKMLAPFLEELTDIEVLKVNVDEHQDLAAKHGIMSIPTLLFFKDGKEVRKEIGFRNLEELKSIIESLKND